MHSGCIEGWGERGCRRLFAAQTVVIEEVGPGSGVWPKSIWRGCSMAKRDAPNPALLREAAQRIELILTRLAKRAGLVLSRIEAMSRIGHQ